VGREIFSLYLALVPKCRSPLFYGKSESFCLSNNPRLPKEHCFLEGFRTSEFFPSGKSNV